MKKKRNNLGLALFIFGAIAFLAAWVYYAELIWNSTLPDWLKVWLIK